MDRLVETRNKGEILTGLIHIDTHAPSLRESTMLSDRPLATMQQEDLRPAAGVIDGINDQFRT